MAENFPNKTANIDNPLARELVAARHKMRERLMIEGQKPLYKNRSNRFTVIGIFGLWLGYKVYNAIQGTQLHESFHD